MKLHDFQSTFKDLMLDHPNALLTPPDNLTSFCIGGKIPLPERFKIYRNNIIGSLTDMMVATFPVLENLVGKDFLEDMSRSFILQSPPTQGCMSAYGEGFAEAIEGFEAAKNFPYFPDIARMELAYNHAYYAHEDQPLTADELGKIAPEDLGELTLPLRQSVHLLSSSYPLAAIRTFCFSEDQSTPPDFNQGGGFFMVYRPHYKSLMIEIEPATFKMLSLLQEEQSLGRAVEEVLEDHPDFDFQVFLEKYISLETFLTLDTNRKIR